LLGANTIRPLAEGLRAAKARRIPTAPVRVLQAA